MIDDPTAVTSSEFDILNNRIGDLDDLTTTARVLPWDAVLGGTTEVNTPEGQVKVKVPAGAQNGMKLRLHGRGLPMRGGTLRGDLFARLEIVIPKDVSGREKELWQKIKDLHAE